MLEFLTSFKDPAKAAIVFLCCVSLGVQIVPKIKGESASQKVERFSDDEKARDAEQKARDKETRAALEELAVLKRDRREADLKDAVLRLALETFSERLSESLAPVMRELETINKDMQRGSRWSLEDEINLYKANGSEGADPAEIQARRMAEEHRKNLLIE